MNEVEAWETKVGDHVRILSTRVHVRLGYELRVSVIETTFKNRIPNCLRLLNRWLDNKSLIFPNEGYTLIHMVNIIYLSGVWCRTWYVFAVFRNQLEKES